MSDLEDLMEDIKVYLEVEKETHYDYWKVGYNYPCSVITMSESYVVYNNIRI